MNKKTIDDHCTCIPAYKDRGLEDPSCASHSLREAILSDLLALEELQEEEDGTKDKHLQFVGRVIADERNELRKEIKAALIAYMGGEA